MSDVISMPELILWSCLGLVVYTYAGYPIVLLCCARLFGRRGTRPDKEGARLPDVSVLIVCHNEAEVIAQQLENTLTLRYPADKLEIVVASDGSTDETADIVSEFAKSGVQLLDYSERRGKAAALNESFPQLNGDVVVLCDANTFLAADAITHLIPWFNDPEIGIVCGRLVLTDPISGTNVDSLYWKYETLLKKYESRLGALLGANGGIYAIRRDLFAPIPDNTIIDDFVIPLSARLRHGCALVYERRAIAREDTPPSVRSEFRRRARIGSGGFQCIPWLWQLLSPNQGWIAFSYLSHKILRWACPFLMIAIMLMSLALSSRHPVYAWLLAAQVGFYSWSVIGSWLPARNRVVKLLKLPTMFVSMNAALLVGFGRWLSGGQKGVWCRTERTVPVAQAWEAVQ